MGRFKEIVENIIEAWKESHTFSFKVIRNLVEILRRMKVNDIDWKLAMEEAFAVFGDNFKITNKQKDK